MSKSAADLKAPAHLPQGILISILTLQGRCQFRAVNYCSEVFNTQEKERSRALLPVFSVHLCEGWGEKALLRRSSRTTLQYGEHRRSMTPPDRKHSEEFIRELMQQDIPYVCHTTLQENKLKCCPLKSIIHTQFRFKDRFVRCLNGSSGWESDSNRVEIIPSLQTLTPAV